MNAPNGETSIWLALRNSAFRRLWLASLVSGICFAAYCTAAFSVMGADASPLVISLMSTVAALPYALFTFPAGAIADMVDRKRILTTVALFQAAVAACLTLLGIVDLLGAVVILASAFLFHLGFACASPASSSVVTEMVSKEEMASANTLTGLHMSISGMVGPALGGLLIPIMGASFVFGLNGVGFVLLFLAVLSWKPARAQTPVPIDEFFTTITTAINYARYGPGIKIILVRTAVLSFFYSIIPSLMPVIGLKELHLEPEDLGYLFAAQGIGSVLGGVFVIPWARARLAPNKLTFCANLALAVDALLMTRIHDPYLFLPVAAIAGAAWALTSSELWIAGQRAMPDWARGRMSATVIMVTQAATAFGGAIWGVAATHAGVVPTFLVAVVASMVVMAVSHLLLRKRLSIDFASSLNFEPAAVGIYAHDLDPMRLAQTKDRPVSVTSEFTIDPARRDECMALMRQLRLIELKNGAWSWHLYEDLTRPNRFVVEVGALSWGEYLRHRGRLTKDEKDVVDRLRTLRLDGLSLEEWPRVSVDREVFGK